jgi:glycosyltransferase involved in cell wall biosynthesis
MMNAFDITVIIPFLNEEENIPFLSREINAFVQKNSNLSFEVILVNDGSTDDSLSRISTTPFPHGTRVISLSRNFGSHAALRAGILHSQSKHICFLYADLQDPVENVLLMHQQALQGSDIVWGTRSSTEGGWLEKAFSRLYASLMRRFVNPKFPEKGFDIVMISQKVAQQLNNNLESHSSIFLQLLNLGFRQGEVEYEKRMRTAGKSKWTLSKKFKLVVDSFIAFSYAPIRFVTYAGIFLFLIGVCWTIYITVRKLISDDLVSGWPMLTSILFLGFGLTNISLGIIAEYLWRTLDSSRRRPVFIIDEIIELTGRKS